MPIKNVLHLLIAVGIMGDFKLGRNKATLSKRTWDSRIDVIVRQESFQKATKISVKKKKPGAKPSLPHSARLGGC